MSKIAIAMCGSSGIDYVCPDHRMAMFRSLLILDGKSYKDYEDISIDEFYEKLSIAKTVKTAQTSTGELISLFERLRDEGYTDVICITISSGLSGTYQGVLLASRMVEGIKVHPFDSLFLGYPEAKMGLVAKKMIAEGKSISEIMSKLEELRDSQNILICVDTLKYLVMNGRLSASSGLISNLLKIKLLLGRSFDGKIEVIEKIRTKHKAIDRMIDLVIDKMPDEQVEAYLLYTNNYDEVLKVREEILKRTDKIKEIGIYPLPPVIGIHGGPGTFGFGFIKYEEC